MPRRRVTWSGRKKGRGIPPGVKAAALADQLAGGRTIAETAAAFGIDVTTVKALAETVAGINPDDVARIERGLPRLFAVLSARHAVEALRRAETDPATAVKSTFGAKLAAEAGRISAPAADAPGVQILAFIGGLSQRPAAPPAGELAPVVDLGPPAAHLQEAGEPDGEADGPLSAGPLEREAGP
jgi:hypothetical protein